jgi:hypothetical protein
MAELFRGKTMEELDELAGSFRFENCVLREELNEILKLDAEASSALQNVNMGNCLMTGQKEEQGEQQQHVEHIARL